MAEDLHLSAQQRAFITLVRHNVEAKQAGDKFILTWERHHKVARQENHEIQIRLDDAELIELANLGYVGLYLNTEPKTIVFNESIWGAPENPTLASGPATPYSDKVFNSLNRQVYIWLIACLVFAFIAVVLLLVTVYFLITGQITATIVPLVITLISGVASGVFLKSYNEANERLKNFGSENQPQRR